MVKFNIKVVTRHLFVSSHDGGVIRTGIGHLKDMKCAVMIWRSWVQMPVGSNLGCVVLSKLYLSQMSTKSPQYNHFACFRSWSNLFILLCSVCQGNIISLEGKYFCNLNKARKTWDLWKVLTNYFTIAQLLRWWVCREQVIEKAKTIYIFCPTWYAKTIYSLPKEHWNSRKLLAGRNVQIFNDCQTVLLKRSTKW